MIMMNCGSVVHNAKSVLFSCNPCSEKTDDNKCTQHCTEKDTKIHHIINTHHHYTDLLSIEPVNGLIETIKFLNKVVDNSDKQWSVTCDVCHKIYCNYSLVYYYYSRPYFTVIITSTKRKPIILMMIMKKKIKSLELVKSSNTLTQLNSSILIYQILPAKCTQIYSCDLNGQIFDDFNNSNSNLNCNFNDLIQRLKQLLLLRFKSVDKQLNLQINIYFLISHSNLRSTIHCLSASTERKSTKADSTTTSIKQLNSFLTIRFFFASSLLNSPIKAVAELTIVKSSLMNSWTLSNFIANHSSISKCSNYLILFSIEDFYSTFYFDFHSNLLSILKFYMNELNFSILKTINSEFVSIRSILEKFKNLENFSEKKFIFEKLGSKRSISKLILSNSICLEQSNQNSNRITNQIEHSLPKRSKLFLNYVISNNLVRLFFICYFRKLFKFINFYRLVKFFTLLINWRINRSISPIKLDNSILDSIKDFTQDCVENSSKRPKLRFSCLPEMYRNDQFYAYNHCNAVKNTLFHDWSIQLLWEILKTKLIFIINQIEQFAHQQNTVRLNEQRIVQQNLLSIDIRPSYSLKSPNEFKNEDKSIFEHHLDQPYESDKENFFYQIKKSNQLDDRFSRQKTEQLDNQFNNSIKSHNLDKLNKFHHNDQLKPIDNSTSNYYDVRWNKIGCSKLSYWLSILLILLSITCSVRGTALKRNAEKKILDSIIGQGKYDSRIRPSGVNNTLEKDGPCHVRVNIFVRSIGKISDLDMEYSIQITFREQWNDSRLEFNPVNNISYLTLTEPEKIWKPDLFFSNEKEGHFHNIIMPNVLLRIHPNGQVLYSIRISLVLSCPMNLKYYPLDKQTCKIKMGSYGYTTEDLIFFWKETDPVQVTQNLNLPTFSLYNFLTDYCTSSTNTGTYSCIVVDLIFKREFSYYLIQIYIPNSMLVIVSWVSFWLDPNAIPARVSLGVTTLLTMATQISGINASLPPVSYTKAIDVWTGVCLTFVFGALIEFALVNYASRKDQQKKLRKQNQQNNHLVMGPNGQFINSGNMLQNNNTGTIGPLTGFGMTNAMGPIGMTSSGNRMCNYVNNINTKQMKHIIAPPKIDFTDQNFLYDHQNEQRNNLPVIMPNNRNRPNDMRSCEVTINPLYSNKNFLSKWLASFPNKSKKIDVISRIIFPVMFGCFHVVYWSVYLLREDKIQKP